MGLDQPVAVKEGLVASAYCDLLLLVGHPRHESQGHPPRAKLFRTAASAQVGQVVAGVGVSKGTALWVENTEETGYEHVGGYAGIERIVNSFEYLAHRVHREGYGPKHAAGRGHHQRCRNAMTGGVPDNHSQATVF